MRLNVLVHKLNHIARSNREVLRKHTAERGEQSRRAKAKINLPVLGSASSIGVCDRGRCGDANLEDQLL